MIKGTAFVAYSVSDMARSREFYENVLGLKAGELTGDYWFEYALDDGTTFGIGCFPEDGPEFFKNKGSAMAFDVEKLEVAMERMKSHNVPIIHGPVDYPGCRMIVITDPDNNVITLHQSKKN